MLVFLEFFVLVKSSVLINGKEKIKFLVSISDIYE